MAKKVSASEATKKVTERDKIQAELGAYFANSRNEAIDRLKEGILLCTGDGDVVIKVIAKKEEIQYTDDDVLETYEPTADETDSE